MFFQIVFVVVTAAIVSTVVDSSTKSTLEEPLDWFGQKPIYGLPGW